LQSRSDEIRSLQAGLAQWQTDLDQLADLSGTPSWDWDGRVLRLTRRSAAAPVATNANAKTTALPGAANNAGALPASPSVQVVAWTWRNDPGRPGGGDWQRWQSGPLQQRADWQNAWTLAQQWGQTPDASTRAGQVQIHPLAGWQLFVHRGGSWTNPLSSAAVNPDTSPGGPEVNARNPTPPGATPSSNIQTAPDGVRLVLSLPPGPVGQGALTLDWVRPTLSGPPS
jgi:general secretion pathway protein J